MLVQFHNPTKKNNSEKRMVEKLKVELVEKN